MIHKFSAKNFYSIDEKVEIDFTAIVRNNSPVELYLDAPFSKKVTKIAFVGGANGAGKSNAMRILAFLKYLLTVSGATSSPSVPFVPFVPRGNAPSDFSVEFSFDPDRVYKYFISLTRERILSEELICTSLITKRTSSKTLFSRKYNENQKSYAITDRDNLAILKNIPNLEGVLSTPENQTKTIVSLYASIDAPDGVLRKIHEYWNNLKTNIVSFGNIEAEYSASNLANRALEQIYNSSDSSTSRQLLNKIDISFSGIENIPIEEDSNSKIFGIRHKFAKADFPLASFQESTGTNRIVYLISQISDALSNPNCKVAVFDDMDAFVHPDIYELLLGYFMNSEKNPRGVQLIFASHNYITLNSLEKQQIFLVERNENGASEVYRLDEVDGVEARDNFYSKYMAGAYGAVPRSEKLTLG